MSSLLTPPDPIAVHLRPCWSHSECNCLTEAYHAVHQRLGFQPGNGSLRCRYGIPPAEDRRPQLGLPSDLARYRAFLETQKGRIIPTEGLVKATVDTLDPLFKYDVSSYRLYDWKCFGVVATALEIEVAFRSVLTLTQPLIDKYGSETLTWSISTVLTSLFEYTQSITDGQQWLKTSDVMGKVLFGLAQLAVEDDEGRFVPKKWNKIYLTHDPGPETHYG